MMLENWGLGFRPFISAERQHPDLPCPPACNRERTRRCQRAGSLQSNKSSSTTLGQVLELAINAGTHVFSVLAARRASRYV